MFCPNCGTEVGAGNKYCTSCGAGITSSSVSLNLPSPVANGEGKKKLFPTILACVAVLILVGVALAFIIGELSKGALEGHTSASVALSSASTQSDSMTFDFDLNANNGSFTLEADMSDLNDHWAGASYSKLWFDGTYDCVKADKDPRETYSWTVTDIRCDGPVPQSELDKLKDRLNSANFELGYDGSFPCGKWELEYTDIDFAVHTFALDVSEIGTGNTTLCGALEFTFAIEGYGSSPVQEGLWWRGEQASDIPGGPNGSYEFSIEINNVCVEGTIYR